jgi:hypothetical protein
MRTPQAGDVSFSVLPSYIIEHGWKPITLDPATLAIDAEGWFEVTLDAGAGDGAPGHIRLPPKGERLTVRDSMMDWSQEFPMQLEIRRLGREEGPVAAADPEQVSARLAPHLHGYIQHHISLTGRVIYGHGANVIPPPATGPSGGLLTQALSNGWFDLQEDEALMVEVDPMGARYLSLQIWDPWMFSLNYRDQTGSLNKAQACADGDARYRFVIAKHDPGVHNWINTDGLLEGGVAMRWQGLQHGLKRDGIALTARRVPIARLHVELPGDTRWVNSEERREQHAARRAAHDRRFFL